MILSPVERELIDLARDVVPPLLRQAAERALQMRSDGLQMDQKGGDSLSDEKRAVSGADREAQLIVLNGLIKHDRFRACKLFAEEKEGPKDQFDTRGRYALWIDALDGSDRFGKDSTTWGSTFAISNRYQIFYTCVQVPQMNFCLQIANDRVETEGSLPFTTNAPHNLILTRHPEFFQTVSELTAAIDHTKCDFQKKGPKKAIGNGNEQIGRNNHLLAGCGSVHVTKPGEDSLPLIHLAQAAGYKLISHGREGQQFGSTVDLYDIGADDVGAPQLRGGFVVLHQNFIREALLDAIILKQLS